VFDLSSVSMLENASSRSASEKRERPAEARPDP